MKTLRFTFCVLAITLLVSVVPCMAEDTVPQVVAVGDNQFVLATTEYSIDANGPATFLRLFKIESGRFILTDYAAVIGGAVLQPCSTDSGRLSPPGRFQTANPQFLQSRL